MTGSRREPIEADPVMSDETFTEEGFTEEELAELALACDSETPLAADAVPLPLYLGTLPMMLPQWYMPPALLGRTTRWRTALVLVIVVALVMIEAYGLCSTYGST